MDTKQTWKSALMVTALALPLVAGMPHHGMMLGFVPAAYAQGGTADDPRSLAALGHYLLPDSHTREISDVEIYNVAQSNPNLGTLNFVLRLMRAEIYARKGQRFQDRNIQAYFSERPWYSPRSGNVQLSGTELRNASTIQKLEGQLARDGAITLSETSQAAVIAGSNPNVVITPEAPRPVTTLQPIPVDPASMQAIPGAAVPVSQLPQINAQLAQQIEQSRSFQELPRGPMPVIPDPATMQDPGEHFVPQDPTVLNADMRLDSTMVAAPGSLVPAPVGTGVDGPRIAPRPSAVPQGQLFQHAMLQTGGELNPATKPVPHPQAGGTPPAQIALTPLGYSLPGANPPPAVEQSLTMGGVPVTAMTQYASPQVMGGVYPGGMYAGGYGYPAGMTAASVYAQSSLYGAAGPLGAITAGPGGAATLVLPHDSVAASSRSVVTQQSTPSVQYSNQETRVVTTTGLGIAGGEILPDSDARVLSNNDILAMVDARGDLGNREAVLRLARNEIFARKGRRFTSPILNQYFQAQDWYQPRSSSVNLTAIERRNVANLLQLEKRYSGARRYSFADGQRTTTTTRYTSGGSASGSGAMISDAGTSYTTQTSYETSHSVADYFLGPQTAVPGSMNPAQYSNLSQSVSAPIFSPNMPQPGLMMDPGLIGGGMIADPMIADPMMAGPMMQAPMMPMMQAPMPVMPMPMMQAPMMPSPMMQAPMMAPPRMMRRSEDSVSAAPLEGEALQVAQLAAPLPYYPPQQPGFVPMGPGAMPMMMPAPTMPAPMMPAPMMQVMPQPEYAYPTANTAPQGVRVGVAGKMGTAPLYRAAAPQNGNTGFFIMPESQTRIVGPQEIMAVAQSFAHLGSVKDVLRLMRAEIYARNGFSFQQGDLAAFFAQQPWYRGYNTMFTLTPIEEHNYNLIEAMERRL